MHQSVFNLTYITLNIFYDTSFSPCVSHCFIVGHVHDELIIEASMGVDINAICEQMGRTPDWIEGLALNADRYCTKFYKKD